MGVLTLIDGQTLSRYCHLWSRWRKAEAFIAARGDMYPIEDERGRVKCMNQWPQVGIANNLSQRLTRLEQELGLTPSTRTRIHIFKDALHRPSPKDRFFRAV